MEFLFSLLIAGVSVGSAYALVAIGLNMTFWTTRTLNFGQGSLMMLCALLTADLASRGVWLALATLASLALVGLLGAFVERFTVRPALKMEGSMGWVVSTLGFGTLVQGIAATSFGSQAVAFPDVVFSASDTVTIFGQPAALQYLVIFVLALGIVAFLELFLRRTIWGQVIQAVSFDQELGRVQGMPVARIILLSFVASSLLAGLTGMLVAQIGGTVDPAFGFDLVLLGFVSAVLGGMGSSVGALVGGIVVGLLSKLVGGYISSAAEHGIAFALLMVMLAVRPQGLFARTEAVKV